MNTLKLISVIITLSTSIQGTAQISLNNLEKKLEEFDYLSDALIRDDSTTLVWVFYDSFTRVNKFETNSSNQRKNDSISIYLKIEKGWTPEFLAYTQSLNSKIIDSLAQKYLEYVHESEIVRAYKYDSSYTRNQAIVWALNQNYPMPFSKSDKKYLMKYRIIPDHIIDAETAIFVYHNLHFEEEIKEVEIAKRFQGYLDYVHAIVKKTEHNRPYEK